MCLFNNAHFGAWRFWKIASIAICCLSIVFVSLQHSYVWIWTGSVPRFRKCERKFFQRAWLQGEVIQSELLFCDLIRKHLSCIPSVLLVCLESHSLSLALINRSMNRCPWTKIIKDNIEKKLVKCWIHRRQAIHTQNGSKRRHSENAPRKKCNLSHYYAIKLPGKRFDCLCFAFIFSFCIISANECHFELVQCTYGVPSSSYAVSRTHAAWSISISGVSRDQNHHRNVSGVAHGNDTQCGAKIQKIISFGNSPIFCKII